MWNQWKIFEKITKDLKHVPFWGPKWLGSWRSEANIQHTSKDSSNWHVNQDWCKTKYLRKWPKTRIFTYFVIWSGPKIGPLRPIFSSHLKLLAMSMRSNTDMKRMRIFTYFWAKMAPKLGHCVPYSTHGWMYLQWACEAVLMWNHFEKVTEVQNFYLLSGPKWPKIGPLRFVFYTSLKVAPMSI